MDRSTTVVQSAVNGLVTGSNPVAPVMKLVCKRCSKEVKPNKHNKIHNKNYCAGCLVSVRRNKLKEKAINQKGGKCQTCGYNKCKPALTFHHLDPNTKSFEINSNKMFAISWSVVEAELNKCILLCSNCHFELHDKEIEDKYNKIKDKN